MSYTAISTFTSAFGSSYGGQRHHKNTSDAQLQLGAWCSRQEDLSRASYHGNYGFLITTYRDRLDRQCEKHEYIQFVKNAESFQLDNFRPSEKSHVEHVFCVWLYHDMCAGLAWFRWHAPVQVRMPSAVRHAKTTRGHYFASHNRLIEEEQNECTGRSSIQKVMGIQRGSP